MKQAVFSFLLLVVVSLAHAELYKPNRIVEFGTTVTAGASNNYFRLPDVLTEHVVLDLRKIAEEMPGGGLNLDALGDAKTYIDLNFSPQFRLGFFMGVEGNGNVTVAKDLFDLLGKGTESGESLSCDIKGNGDVFATTGVSFATRWRGYGIKITPTYFVPIAYVADAKATVSYQNTKDGAIKAVAHAPVDIYTAIDMEHVKDDGFKTDYISEAVKNGGFDLSFAVEKQVLRTLDVGMHTRVPLVPGRLNYKMTANVYANFIETKALGFIDNTEEHSLDYGVDDITYSTASFAAFRPFKLGIEAAWRPFGKWMVFRPELAVVMRNPYSSAAIIYPEYSLGAEFSLFNVVRLQAATAYRDRVFVQSVGVALNVRLIEIELGAAFRGAEFTNSFNYSGAGAFAAVRIGF